MFLAKYSWFILGITAGASWGLAYLMYDKIMDKIPVALVMVLVAVFSLLFWGAIALYRDQFDIIKTLIDDKDFLIKAAILIIFSTIANGCLLYSISFSNATKAAMIEISYPLFVALFAYLLFKEVQLSGLALVGGAFMIVGAFIMAYASS